MNKPRKDRIGTADRDAAIPRCSVLRKVETEKRLIMKSRIAAHLARFFRDEEGPAAVEYAFFLSMLVVVVMATLQVFA